MRKRGVGTADSDTFWRFCIDRGTLDGARDLMHICWNSWRFASFRGLRCAV